MARDKQPFGEAGENCYLWRHLEWREIESIRGVAG